VSTIAGRADAECLQECAALIRAFDSGNLEPQYFDHEAHVRVAWCYLQTFPAAMAIARFTEALRSLTVRLGVAQKYHETISWFFMIVIADRQARSPASDWETFKRQNRDLLEQGSALLKRHYSADCLDSMDARQRFVLPDLAPLGLHESQ
jgi:hypothetical protein